MYKNTNPKLHKIIKLFHKNMLEYNLFKCEHIFQGENKNLDVLFKTYEDYQRASQLLQKDGLVLCMPESVEKYKRMYLSFSDGILTAVHLHREIAWHGIRVIDKNIIFSRQRKLNEQIIVPSCEDSLRIHIAHILFENFKVKERENRLIESILSQKLNWNYIKEQTKREGWYSGLRQFLNYFKNNLDIPVHLCLKTILIKANLNEQIYLLKKLIKKIRRNSSLKRKGTLIALIGVNGSGKTTLAKETLKKYYPINRFLNGQFGYYFGWDPFLPITKLISKRLERKNKKIFNKLNDNKNQFNLIKELILIYNYIEYFSRYLVFVYPKLRHNKLVLTDRYFYDFYAQYNYAPKSRIIKLLFLIYPKPDYLFVLDANLETITKRDKNIEMFSRDIIKSSKRELHEIAYLKDQKKRYNYLCKYLKGEMLNTEEPINMNTDKIVGKTWNRLIK